MTSKAFIVLTIIATVLLTCVLYRWLNKIVKRDNERRVDL